MHAVVVTVALSGQPDPTELRERVVPRVSQLPGFVAGYWTRKDNSGVSMVIFESADDARAASDQVPSMLPGNVTIQSNEVREVVAHA
jgi:hypothetical protein